MTDTSLNLTLGPMTGIRVVDLTTMISGPVATMMLADQGADVIKVENAIGDLVRHMGLTKEGRSATFISANRNKKSISVDLKTPEGKELLLKLVSTADVFVQNFRPGTAERMGLGENALRAIRPDLVYVSISGFGEEGPYAAKRVYDPVIQALSGLAAIQRDRATGRPHMVRTIVPDKVSALTASQAITAALFARERTGQGQHVKINMLDAMIAFLWPEGLVPLTFEGGEKSASRAQLAQDLIYETQDGYITVGAVSDSEWKGLCTSLEKPEWLEDERFNTPAGRVANASERLSQTQLVLATKPSAEWLEILDENEVPCAPILGLTDLLDHPQLKANKIVQTLEDPQFGTIRQPRPAPTFSATPAGIRSTAPYLGADGEAIASELGYSTQEIATMLDDKVLRVPKAPVT